MLRIIPLLCSFIAAGVVAGRLVPLDEGIALVAASISCILAGGLASSRRLGVATVALVGLTVGWLRVVPEPSLPHTERRDFEEVCWRTIQGKILRTSYDVDGSALVELHLTGASACARAPGARPLEVAAGRLFANIEHNSWTPWPEGAHLRLHAKIRPGTRRRNFAARRKDDPAWKVYLHDASSMAAVSAPGDISAALERARIEIIRMLSENMSPRGARLAGALLLGDPRLLSFEQRRIFRESGTAHLLSISGLHLGLIALVAFTGLRRALVLLAPRTQLAEPGRIAAAFTLCICVAFTIWVGARTPVVRACVMSGFVLIGRLFGSRAAAPESLSAAAAALLLWDPTFAKTPGFQLSFAAVLGFVLFTQRRKRTLFEVFEVQNGPCARMRGLARRTLRYTVSLVRGTLAATAVTTPIVMWHFDHACGLSVLGNLIAVPVVGFFVLPLLAAVGAVAAFHVDAHGAWLFGLLDSGFAALHQALFFISGLPGNLYGPSALQSVAVVLWCLAILAGLRRAGRLSLTCALLGLGLFSSAAIFESDGSGKLTVDFLDVGQGDSALATFPDGRRWLIDAAGAYGTYDAGKVVVVPALKRLGVDELDTVVLSHPDTDHVGGLSAVLSAIPTRRLWDNGQGRGAAGPAYDAAMASASNNGVRIERTPDICKEHAVGPVTVRVLHPCEKTGKGFEPSASFNANSVVLHMGYGRTSFLFTGDIDEEVERRLVERFPDLDATVLKLAHHGSKTSSSRFFLEAVSPSAAVASAAPHNVHRLPSPAIAARLQQMGIRFWRTDQQGRIRISSDGQVVRFRAVAGPLTHRLRPGLGHSVLP